MGEEGKMPKRRRWGQNGSMLQKKSISLKRRNILSRWDCMSGDLKRETKVILQS